MLEGASFRRQSTILAAACEDGFVPDDEAVHYYRRQWDERRGDRHDDWGASTWYFETDESGGVLRQLEIYDGGQRRRYDQVHQEDADGALSESPLAPDEWAPWRITREGFEAEW